MAATQLKFFSSEITFIPSQPVNHWKRTHTLFGEVNLAVLSLVILDKIQSQQVNQEERTHLLQEALNRYINGWKATTVWNFFVSDNQVN